MIREIARSFGDFLAGDPRSLPDLPQGMDERLRRILAFAGDDTAQILGDLQNEYGHEIDSHDFTIVGDQLRLIIANSRIAKTNLNDQTKAKFKEEVANFTSNVIDSHLKAYLEQSSVKPVEIGLDSYFEYLVIAREIAEISFRLHGLKIPPEIYPHHTTISLGFSQMHAIRDG